ncbi:MAG: hypothetical protein IIB42_09875 [Candidatus Marinimicrobia bacterium]|nr:hypothetical protein [Candidatus Neomarinimicrobiota bacterium]
MPEYQFHADPKTSENMRKIRGKDTMPEIAVRRICREFGYTGYRLHCPSLRQLKFQIQ